MSRKKKQPPKRTGAQRSASARRRTASTGTRPRNSRSARTSDRSSNRASDRTQTRHSTRSSTSPKRWRIARCLWATVAALLIAALLLEPTMLWMIGVGLWMLANGELIGSWMLVVGYILACIPWAIGLLIATGSFWRSMTHALWIGALYAVVGTLLLEHLVGLVG